MIKEYYKQKINKNKSFKQNILNENENKNENKNVNKNENENKAMN